MVKSSAAENPAIVEVSNCQSGRKPENQLTTNTRHSHVLYSVLFTGDRVCMSTMVLSMVEMAMSSFNSPFSRINSI